MNSEITLISGSSNRGLADKISQYIKKPLAKCILDKFSNGERRVEIQNNIRKTHVFVIQTGVSDTQNSINDYLMETMLILDACKRSDAKTITLILPCYFYARQDKKDRPRVPISARIVANMLARYINRLIVVDLHASQITGFLDIPVDNLYAINNFINWFRTDLFSGLTENEIRSKFIYRRLSRIYEGRRKIAWSFKFLGKII